MEEFQIAVVKIITFLFFSLLWVRYIESQEDLKYLKLKHKLLFVGFTAFSTARVLLELIGIE